MRNARHNIIRLRRGLSNPTDANDVKWGMRFELAPSVAFRRRCPTSSTEWRVYAKSLHYTTAERGGGSSTQKLGPVWGHENI